MKILEATQKDSHVLAKMATKIWENQNEDELEEEFKAILQSDEETCFIAFVKDMPVGFANVSLRFDYVEGTESSPVGYLEGIFVEENYRKQNIAKNLVKSCEDWAKKIGCTEFASDCLLDNTKSLKFHLAVGFIEANRIICFKKDL
ncbi:MAG: GNAT family N-acetyltransferase [Finegoldia magna]|uniref:aminoglycoside 6'-N-acetyltransferase n=1 Tax=Finegoldia magna TaxID=1260 RepID=UPI00242E8025|nr:aminoglycoside 6'-N-acetyltransferase [Finegoldia magna]MBS5970972.1 GNAT family N-acetyltransferase [Finegoldia magna]